MQITLKVPATNNYWDKTTKDMVVNAKIVNSGLAIHKTVGTDDRWTVTHINSGCGLWQNIKGLKTAKALMDAVLPLLDWTQDKQAVEFALFESKDKTINYELKRITRELGLRS